MRGILKSLGYEGNDVCSAPSRTINTLGLSEDHYEETGESVP